MSSKGVQTVGSIQPRRIRRRSHQSRVALCRAAITSLGLGFATSRLTTLVSI